MCTKFDIPSWTGLVCVVFTSFVNRPTNRRMPRQAPAPYHNRIKKNPLLGYIWSSTAKVKILPHHLFGALKAKITPFFCKNQHEIRKKLAQNTPFASTFQKNFPGEAPAPPPARGDIPRVPTVLEKSLNFGFSLKVLENEFVLEKSLNLGDLPWIFNW